jgi:hypothetical protein
MNQQDLDKLNNQIAKLKLSGIKVEVNTNGELPKLISAESINTNINKEIKINPMSLNKGDILLDGNMLKYGINMNDIKYSVQDLDFFIGACINYTNSLYELSYNNLVAFEFKFKKLLFEGNYDLTQLPIIVNLISKWLDVKNKIYTKVNVDMGEHDYIANINLTTKYEKFQRYISRIVLNLCKDQFSEILNDTDVLNKINTIIQLLADSIGNMFDIFKPESVSKVHDKFAGLFSESGESDKELVFEYSSILTSKEESIIKSLDDEIQSLGKLIVDKSKAIYGINTSKRLEKDIELTDLASEEFGVESFDDIQFNLFGGASFRMNAFGEESFGSVPFSTNTIGNTPLESFKNREDDEPKPSIFKRIINKFKKK